MWGRGGLASTLVWAGVAMPASVPVSETKDTAEGSRELRGRRGQPRMPPTPTHQPPQQRGDRGRGCEMVGCRARRQGDTEMDMCYSVSCLVYILHARK